METASSDLPAYQPGASSRVRPLSPEELGDLYEVRHRYQLAISAYSKVERFTVGVWNKMGIAYQMMFNAKEALRCYKEALRLEPRNPHSLNNVATVYEGQRNYGEAERYFRRALKVDPDNPVVFKNLGTNQLMQGKYNAGMKAYREALKLDPHIFELHDGPQMDDPAPPKERGTANYFVAQSCALAGMDECALTHLRKAINEGGATRKRINSDPAFEALRQTPALEKVLIQTGE